jgi:hypothetical protein
MADLITDRTPAEPPKPFGRQVLDQIDPEGTILTADQHATILSYSGPEQISRLLTAQLGDAMNPDLKLAHDVLGDLDTAGLSIPQMVMAVRFHTIAQLMIVISDSRAIARERGLTKTERLDAARCEMQACAEITRVVNHITHLANKLNMMPAKARKRWMPPAKKAAVGVAPVLA